MGCKCVGDGVEEYWLSVIHLYGPCLESLLTGLTISGPIAHRAANRSRQKVEPQRRFLVFQPLDEGRQVVGVELAPGIREVVQACGAIRHVHRPVPSEAVEPRNVINRIRDELQVGKAEVADVANGRQSTAALREWPENGCRPCGESHIATVFRP